MDLLQIAEKIGDGRIHGRQPGHGDDDVAGIVEGVIILLEIIPKFQFTLLRQR